MKGEQLTDTNLNKTTGVPVNGEPARHGPATNRHDAITRARVSRSAVPASLRTGPEGRKLCE